MNNSNTKYENISESLIETFLKMDEMLQTPQGKTELKHLAKVAKEEDAEQDKKNKKDKSKDFAQYFDPKNSENCEIIANITGCTACVSVIDEKNKKIYFANAGDSRSVLCRNGQAFAMSTDHKPNIPAEFPNDATNISTSGPLSPPNFSLLTCAFIGKIRLSPWAQTPPPNKIHCGLKILIILIIPHDKYETYLSTTSFA